MTPDAKLSGKIFIVDDEPAVLDTVTVVLTHHGHQVRTFSDGGSFLAVAKSEIPACVLLDVRMPGRSGLDILKDLNAQQYPAPILVMSGMGDIPMAVDAIRSGALDFIEKPFDGPTLAQRVRAAIDASERRRNTQPSGLGEFAVNEQLTAREREVLTQIAGGASNKEAGRHLGISPRTIEVHRARIMEKLGAKNAADLVRIVMSHRPVAS